MAYNRYKYFVGIDVSKGTLDYAILLDHTLYINGTCANDNAGILGIIEKVKALSRYGVTKTLFCMEHTGLYTTLLIKLLDKVKATYVLENPLRLKTSLGIARGKSDAIDAYRIAQYAFKHQHSLQSYTKRRDVIEEIAALVMLRNRLVLTNLSLTNPINEFKGILPAKQISEQKQYVEESVNMSVLNAIRYKLVLRVFACVRQNRTYQDNFQSLNNTVNAAV